MRSRKFGSATPAPADDRLFPVLENTRAVRDIFPRWFVPTEFAVTTGLSFQRSERSKKFWSAESVSDILPRRFVRTEFVRIRSNMRQRQVMRGYSGESRSLDGPKIWASDGDR